jgi:hypothetical protein
MEKLINAQTVASEIRMTRAGTKSTIIVLEGREDIELYKNLFVAGVFEVVASYGKQNAVGAIQILNAEGGIDRYLSIVDSDFDKLREHDSDPNIFRTDFHDSETGFFLSPAFERVCTEYCSEKSKRVDLRGASIAEHMMMNLRALSYLRYLSFASVWSLDFDEISHDRFIDKRNLSIDIAKMIRHVVQNTVRLIDKKISEIDDIADVQRLRHIKQSLPVDSSINDSLDSLLRTEQFALVQVTNGHDLVAIYCIALRKLLASAEPKVADPSNMAKVLRLAYNSRDFFNTQLCKDLMFWERTSGGAEFVRKFNEN